MADEKYKRWLVPLELENKKWLEMIIHGEDFNGGDVINELINQARQSEPKKFKAALKTAFYKRKIKELQAQLKGEGKKEDEPADEEEQPAKI